MVTIKSNKQVRRPSRSHDQKRRLTIPTSIPTTVLPTVKSWIQSLLPIGQQLVLEQLSPAELAFWAKKAYLQEVCMSKYVDEKTDPPAVRRARAILKWQSQELIHNAATEERLLVPGDTKLAGVPVERFLCKCRDIIAKLIGDTVPEDCLFGGFAGGASTCRKRGPGSIPAARYAGKAHVSWWALGIAQVLNECTPHWTWTLPCDTALDEGEEPEVDPDLLSLDTFNGNVMFTVPKKVDIDRVAAKEPGLNMYLQKGVGNHIRRCLKTAGIDLNDQSINRDLARKGSRDGSLSTIDLSSASDSVTVELVQQLLPPLWSAHLMDLRSPFTFIEHAVDNSEWHKNVMISSMGNGYTFELESLLFYAITRTVCYFTGVKGVVSVYGDDIIVPTDAVPDLITSLEWLGFQVNTDKSAFSGYFRESCGGHYWNGEDITPFFIRGPLNDVSDVILLANQIREWAGRDGMAVLDPAAEAIWKYLASFVPKWLWGGENLGSRTQLYSPHVPDLQLSPLVWDKEEPNELSRYLWSLDHDPSTQPSFQVANGVLKRMLNGRLVDLTLGSPGTDGGRITGLYQDCVDDCIRHYLREELMDTQWFNPKGEEEDQRQRYKLTRVKGRRTISTWRPQVFLSEL